MWFNYKFIFTNCAFVVFIFIVIFVSLNIYFFHILQNTEKIVPYKEGFINDIFHEIHQHFISLPKEYQSKNSAFPLFQHQLLSFFKESNKSFSKDVLLNPLWNESDSLYPLKYGAANYLIQLIKHSPVLLADNAPKGTQMKLLLQLEAKQKVYFKPKRYKLSDIIRGSVYSGFDRHNSEVFAYHLAIVMKLWWIAPSAIRRVNMKYEIMPVATPSLRNTTLKTAKGSYCFYGKCFYCKINETVCPDDKGEIEGAAILYLDKKFQSYKSPWRRSYNKKKMDWELDNNYCKKHVRQLGAGRLLNLIDVAIFDFLLQNGDRHRYELFKDRILLMDNGKGLGNPSVDELDILAPLYQCCMLSSKTWNHLQLISGGSLTETIKMLSSLNEKEPLTTDDHMSAVERRLLKVYATVLYCVSKHGTAKVFRNVN